MAIKVPTRENDKCGFLKRNNDSNFIELTFIEPLILRVIGFHKYHQNQRMRYFLKDKYLFPLETIFELHLLCNKKMFQGSFKMFQHSTAVYS